MVINALTERKGVTVGLITTAGFRDVLEIARGNRPGPVQLHVRQAAAVRPAASPARGERAAGPSRARSVAPLDLAGLRAIVERFRAEGVDAVAICLLHAYANSAHEEEVEQELRGCGPSSSVVASHQITREWREYERTSTTVLSAYVHPMAERYLDRLRAALGERGCARPVYIMQSNCGVDYGRAPPAPTRSTWSSRARRAACWGAVALGRIIGEPNLIALDIGGTTAKCALVEDGRVRITTDY